MSPSLTQGRLFIYFLLGLNRDEVTQSVSDVFNLLNQKEDKLRGDELNPQACLFLSCLICFWQVLLVSSK